MLEPNDNPVAQTYQKGLVEQGIPAAAFSVEDIRTEYKKLKGSGVKITMEPTKIDQSFIAVFDDTCGNLIQIVEEVKK